jgi:hypothetical protein
VTAIIRNALDALLPEALEDVQVWEAEQRESAQAVLEELAEEQVESTGERSR